jgi:hypothetical protein
MIQSTKFKKFGIKDSFLQLITIKYEKIIPWQSIVKDESTFNSYLKDVLIPELENKTKFSEEDTFSNLGKSFFINIRDVDVDLFLQIDLFSQEERKQILKNYKDLNNTDIRRNIAKSMWLTLNKRKEDAFKVWFDYLKKKYPKNLAFQYLILKPIIEQSGYNSRRTIAAPDTGVLKWLFNRMDNGMYNPNTNFASEYRLRLIYGLSGRVLNGWQYIPASNSNVSKLTSASAGSGWCVADYHFAHQYIKSCDFYILRENGKPTVACRVGKKYSHILEIRGKNNDVALQYYPEIWFFINTIFSKYSTPESLQNNWELSYMLPNFCTIIENSLKLNANNLEWWQEMVDKWPASFEYVPNELKTKIEFKQNELLTNSFYLKLGFADKYGIKYSEKDFVNLIKQYPNLYSEMVFKETDAIKNACIEGTLNRLVLNDITITEFSSLPEFVKESSQIKNRLQTHFPKSFEKIVRRGKNYTERFNPVRLEDYLAFDKNESLEITVLRATEDIIQNKSSDFTDVIFSDEILKHPNFKEIRKQAWLKAVIKNPTFYFAFPVDLIQDKVWKPQTEIDEKKVTMLNKWIQSIESRPWYLESEGKVPNSVKYHESLLRAYVKGWSEILKKNPSRIWKKVNSFQRVYLSYAALRNHHIFLTLVNSFGPQGKYYNKSSNRMRAIPAYQLAILYSSLKTNLTYGKMQNLIEPLHPKRKEGVKPDPHRDLLNYFQMKNHIQLGYLINNKNLPENFYFNYISPSEALRVQTGCLVELEIDGELALYSIGIKKEGHQFISIDSTEAQFILNKREGDFIPELNIRIKRITSVF